ncbi:MAG: acetate--CoA ligase family protein [Acidimicrobiales bacterium]
MADPLRPDVSGRSTRLRPLDLDRFFQPRSVLVLGATDSKGKPTASMTRKITAWADARQAAVHYVNPNRATVDGRPCQPRVEDVRADTVDLAVILTGNAVDAFRAVLAKTPRYAVIFAAGFAEVGAAGAQKQAELEQLVHDSSTRLLGPNTNLNAFELFDEELRGSRVALITQSGHQGRPIFQGQDLGIALGWWAPTGNEVDLEFADFAAWFAEQPACGVIAAYIEGFKDGRTLRLAADRAASAGVPIVCIKVGRTEEGQSMAMSHTGHLTGSDAVISAAFRQHGITRVRGLDELLDTSAMLARAQPPSRDGVCVYSISGGTGAHMADLAAEAGLRLPDLTPESQAALHQWIPTYLRVSNPVDNGGAPSADWRGRKILDTIVADPNITAVIVPITGALESMSMPFARDLVDVAETTTKPICVVWGSPIGTEAAHTVLRSSSKVITFRTFGNCVHAVKAWVDWHRYRARHRSAFTRPMRQRTGAVDDLLTPAAGRALTEHESKQVLTAYGIPVTREEVVTSVREAVKAAEAIGWPVVLKASSPAVAHKSDLGLVRIGLQTARDVRLAYAELAAASGGEVLVSELVAGGTECVVGISHDDLFGPTVMFGLGGVFVEVLRDVTFRVPPFDVTEARRMVDEVRGSALLRGGRGRPRGDVRALAETLVRVGRLALEQADRLAELDINPLVVRPSDVVAVDALAVLR